MGAQGVWVGTRFVASFESKAPQRHVDAVVKNGSDQTIRTTIYTGEFTTLTSFKHESYL